MEREVVDNRALEEFRERLLRWGELCVQLRELYYRYIDLAAFRSKKCYFPGRRCVRSWNRKYDLGDLTLMWTYIANTAPLCGKLVKALAEVEYEIRRRALESLEKYGGVEKRTNPSGRREIVTIHLKRPVYGYLVLWNGKLYVIWGEFDGLPKNGQLRGAEVERRVLDVIERYKRGEKVEVEVEEYEVDREYERLWLEIPLPESVSKLLGGRSKALVALFRNLGWLLSDDSRYYLEHETGNPGQVALRMFDWIVIVMYVVNAKRTSPRSLLVFKLSVYSTSKTKNGIKPLVKVWAIGTAAKIIWTFYEQFRIALGRIEETLAHGYAVLKALREEAFKREGRTYVVDDVGAWIAFSATVATLVLGDGYVLPFELGVATKPSSRTTIEGTTTKVRELAKALRGVVTGKIVHLRGWCVRLVLPTPPTLAFEKTVKLYKALVNYPAAAVVETNGTRYLFSHNDSGQFRIGKEKAIELYEAIKRLGLKMGVRKNVFVLSYTQLRKLVKHGISVRLLNELEKDDIKEVRPMLLPDPEVVKMILEEVAKMAKIVELSNGRKRIKIIPYDKSKLEEIAAMLKNAGIRISIDYHNKCITIYERRSIELIRKIMSQFFHHSDSGNTASAHVST